MYFRWNQKPQTDDDPNADPWFRVDRRGRGVEEVPAVEVDRIPDSSLSWSADGRRATWVRDGGVYVYDDNRPNEQRIWRAVTLEGSVRSSRMRKDGTAVDFEVGERLYRYGLEAGTVTLLAAKRDLLLEVAIRKLDRFQAVLIDDIGYVQQSR